ncbi:MAG: hypothetical protein WAK83_28960 [Trebonia sp.]|uniref:hypothetical protein n=1 Tax=Trebonia sp. TaxID=2767075 RepID=UPI003BB1A46B
MPNAVTLSLWLNTTTSSSRAAAPSGAGLGWGSGAGLAVGLFAPPLLASVAVAAVVGGVIGEFADHRVERDVHDHSDS